VSELRLHIPAEMAALREALEQSLTEIRAGLLFVTEPDPPADYDALEAELLQCFRLSREAVAAEAPVVYVVAQADLLGHRGPLGAMRAGALLSGARSLAFEGARAGLAANTIALGPEPDPAHVATCARVLLSDAGVSGEVLRVDADHFGKVIP
jgi:hypothetical protein